MDSVMTAVPSVLIAFGISAVIAPSNGHMPTGSIGDGISGCAI